MESSQSLNFSTPSNNSGINISSKSRSLGQDGQNFNFGTFSSSSFSSSYNSNSADSNNGKPQGSFSSSSQSFSSQAGNPPAGGVQMPPMLSMPQMPIHSIPPLPMPSLPGFPIPGFGRRKKRQTSFNYEDLLDPVYTLSGEEGRHKNRGARKSESDATMNATTSAPKFPPMASMLPWVTKSAKNKVPVLLTDTNQPKGRSVTPELRARSAQSRAAARTVVGNKNGNKTVATVKPGKEKTSSTPAPVSEKGKKAGTARTAGKAQAAGTTARGAAMQKLRKPSDVRDKDGNPKVLSGVDAMNVTETKDTEDDAGRTTRPLGYGQGRSAKERKKCKKCSSSDSSEDTPDSKSKKKSGRKAFSDEDDSDSSDSSDSDSDALNSESTDSSNSESLSSSNSDSIEDRQPKDTKYKPSQPSSSESDEDSTEFASPSMGSGEISTESSQTDGDSSESNEDIAEFLQKKVSVADVIKFIRMIKKRRQKDISQTSTRVASPVDDLGFSLNPGRKEVYLPISKEVSTEFIEEEQVRPQVQVVDTPSVVEAKSKEDKALDTLHALRPIFDNFGLEHIPGLVLHFLRLISTMPKVAMSSKSDTSIRPSGIKLPMPEVDASEEVEANNKESKIIYNTRGKMAQDNPHQNLIWTPDTVSWGPQRDKTDLERDHEAVVGEVKNKEPNIFAKERDILTQDNPPSNLFKTLLWAHDFSEVPRWDKTYLQPHIISPSWIPAPGFGKYHAPVKDTDSSSFEFKENDQNFEEEVDYLQNEEDEDVLSESEEDSFAKNSDSLEFIPFRKNRVHPDGRRNSYPGIPYLSPSCRRNKGCFRQYEKYAFKHRNAKNYDYDSESVEDSSDSDYPSESASFSDSDEASSEEDSYSSSHSSSDSESDSFENVDHGHSGRRRPTQPVPWALNGKIVLKPRARAGRISGKKMFPKEQTRSDKFKDKMYHLGPAALSPVKKCVQEKIDGKSHEIYEMMVDGRLKAYMRECKERENAEELETGPAPVISVAPTPNRNNVSIGSIDDWTHDQTDPVPPPDVATQMLDEEVAKTLFPKPGVWEDEPKGRSINPGLMSTEGLEKPFGVFAPLSLTARKAVTFANAGRRKRKSSVSEVGDDLEQAVFESGEILERKVRSPAETRRGRRTKGSERSRASKLRKRPRKRLNRNQKAEDERREKKSGRKGSVGELEPKRREVKEMPRKKRSLLGDLLSGSPIGVSANIPLQARAVVKVPPINFNAMPAVTHLNQFHGNNGMATAYAGPDGVVAQAGGAVAVAGSLPQLPPSRVNARLWQGRPMSSVSSGSVRPGVGLLGGLLGGNQGGGSREGSSFLQLGSAPGVLRNVMNLGLGSQNGRLGNFPPVFGHGGAPGPFLSENVGMGLPSLAPGPTSVGLSLPFSSGNPGLGLPLLLRSSSSSSNPGFGLRLPLGPLSSSSYSGISLPLPSSLSSSLSLLPSSSSSSGARFGQNLPRLSPTTPTAVKETSQKNPITVRGNWMDSGTPVDEDEIRLTLNRNPVDDVDLTNSLDSSLSDVDDVISKEVIDRDSHTLMQLLGGESPNHGDSSNDVHMLNGHMKPGLTAEGKHPTFFYDGFLTKPRDEKADAQNVTAGTATRGAIRMVVSGRK